MHEPQQASRWKELPEDEDIIRSTQVLVVAKDLGPHDEIERMIEEGFAINEIKVTEIEDSHLISLHHGPLAPGNRRRHQPRAEPLRPTGSDPLTVVQRYRELKSF